MSTRNKFLLVFCFIILDMFLLIGFLVVRDATMLNTLKKEVIELNKLDVTTDRFNRDIVSSGNYAIVEEAIKEYLDDYAVLLQEVLQVVDDSKLTTILSYNNYVNDGPEFSESLKYLKKLKEDFNGNIDVLVNNLEEDNIKSFINNKIDDQYYIDLYVELMLNDDMKDGFEETKKLLVKTKTKVNNVIDISNEVLEFLISNNDSWVVEDGEIKFQTEELYNYYNTLISKINTKQKES